MGPTVRKLLLLLGVCALTLAAAACGGDEERTADDVPADAIALIGEDPIPRSEFDALMKRAEANYKNQKKPFPKIGTPEYQDLKTRAVSFLVERYSFRAEADELGVEVSDEDVDKELDKIKKSAFGGDDKKLQEALDREGLTLEQAREEVRERLLRDRVYKKVTEDVEVTDEDVRAHYEKNKAQFTQPASRDVRHILVKQKARADELYAQIRNGADFATLARRFSTDTGTKKAGGKLPVTKGSTVPPFDKAAFALDEGEVSRPVKTTFGWHVIKAIGPVKPAKVTPLEKVEESVRTQLVDQKKSETLRKWLDELKRKYERETVYAAGFEPPKTDTGATTGATTSEQ